MILLHVTQRKAMSYLQQNFLFVFFSYLQQLFDLFEFYSKEAEKYKLN